MKSEIKETKKPKEFEPFDLIIKIENIYDLIGLCSLLNCSFNECLDKVKTFIKNKNFIYSSSDLKLWNINDKSYLWNLLYAKLKEMEPIK